LVAARRATGTTVSVCLPARDEAATVGAIVAAAAELAAAGLVDEIVVADDRSTDGTGAVARAAGAQVVATGGDGSGGTGKGEALWTSLAASTGDVVCWIDADIRDFDARFITGLVAPLLMDPGVDFVKGYYHRPLADEATGAGRTTELVARPLLSLFLPELAGFVQPLSGEYAGRRAVLEELPLVQGWGVDVALLIDVARLVGIRRMAQVDLGVRRHRHRPLAELGPQALGVLMAVLDRAGVDVPAAAELVRFGAGHASETVVVSAAERPPLVRLRGHAEDEERAG
jgi:glucosyl-3-phosphoglycerate synthase